MSKGIAYILSNDTDVTDLLANGASSVQTLFQLQENNLPYIVVIEENTEAFDSMSGASTLDKVFFSVYCVSQTEHGTSGARTILEQARKTLEAQGRGSFGGEILKDIRYDGDYSASLFQEGRGNVVEASMGFVMFRENTLTNPTPISAFTYSNNGQSTTGAITAMAATVTGDVLSFRVADSDLSNFTASGLSLDSATGAITGTLLASCDFEVLAEGKDGTVGSANVYHFYTTYTTTRSTVVTLTQAQYDGLTPDANTYYLIDG